MLELPKVDAAAPSPVETRPDAPQAKRKPAPMPANDIDEQPANIYERQAMVYRECGGNHEFSLLPTKQEFSDAFSTRSPSKRDQTSRNAHACARSTSPA